VTGFRRGSLHQVIRDGAQRAGVTIEYDRRLVGVEQREDGVAVTFADGRVEEGDIVVGADGVGSGSRLDDGLRARARKELPFPAYRIGRQWVVPTSGLLTFLGLVPA
jgi:2-polyprenyl-6-methoxyphenol hydroxylase-like FAD-dependent oxidoreductase